MEKTITGLETQKNNPNRLNVYLDNAFAFGVSRFVGAWLAVGKKLSQDRIDELVSSDAREKAFQKALHYINYQRRTAYEVREKLTEQGFSDFVAADVIGELREKKYLDDRQFAEDWIAYRSQSKPRSQRMFAYELRKKQVSDEDIAFALESAPADEELANRLGEKYLRRYAYLDDKAFEKKLKGVLARRAFSFSTIKKAISDLLEIKNKKESMRK